MLRAKITFPNGDSTRYALNRFGAPTAVEFRDPQGRWEVNSWSYNDQGQPTTATTPRGGTTNYVWTGPDLDRVTNWHTGFAVVFQYEPAYHQVTSVQRCSSVSCSTAQVSFYDTLGRLDSTKVGGSKTTYTHDVRGRLLSVTDPKSHVTSITYHTAGMQNRQSVTALRGDGSWGTTSFGYDGLGRTTSVTDPTGRVFGTGYDTLNRVTSSTGPVSTTTLLGHNDATRTYTVTDPKGQVYTTVRNALGWPETLTDPRGAVERFTYDRNGNVTSYTNRRGQVVQSTYDALDRVATITADLKTTTFAYDSALMWIAVTNDESADTVRLDVDGRPIEASTARGGLRHRLAFSYDPDGQRNTASLEGLSPVWGPRQLEWGYDALGRFNYLEDLGDQPTGITYTPEQLPDTVKLPIVTSGTNKLREQLTYTPAHLVQQVSFNWVAHDTIVGRRYLYDALDRLRRVTRGRAPIPAPPPYADEVRRELSYNPLGRLAGYSDYRDWEQKGVLVCSDPKDKTTCAWTTVSNTTLLRQDTFSYDSVGNRRDHGGVIELGNRLTAFDGFTLEYDADGNLTRKFKAGVWDQTFTWNTLGQLVQVVTNGVATTFGYDGFNRRVRKTTSGVTTRYLWDGHNLIAELDGAGNPIREYAYYPGIDVPHSVRRSSDGAVFYYMTERPGHVTGLINTANQLVNRYEYTPWGEMLTATEGVVQPLRYGAREYDVETGLYYNRARYYDPKLGRFLSEDPLGLAGGINTYAYTDNDPINYRDPMGLCKWQWVKVGETTFQDDDGVIQWWAFEAYECVGPFHPGWVMRSLARMLRNGGGLARFGPEAAVFGTLFTELTCMASPPGTMYVGAGVDLIGIGTPFGLVGGPTGSVGFFLGPNGMGVYGRGGAGIGLNIGVGLEGGIDRKFEGWSLELAASAARFGGNVSWSLPDMELAPSGVGGNIGLGLPVGGSLAATYTGTHHLTNC